MPMNSANLLTSLSLLCLCSSNKRRSYYSIVGLLGLLWCCLLITCCCCRFCEAFISLSPSSSSFTTPTRSPSSAASSLWKRSSRITTTTSTNTITQRRQWQNSVRPVQSTSHNGAEEDSPSRPLQEILNELADCGASFPPTATRQQLEALLERQKRRRKSKDETNVEEENVTSVSMDSQNAATDASQTIHAHPPMEGQSNEPTSRASREQRTLQSRNRNGRPSSRRATSSNDSSDYYKVDHPREQRTAAERRRDNSHYYNQERHSEATRQRLKRQAVNNFYNMQEDDPDDYEYDNDDEYYYDDDDPQRMRRRRRQHQRQYEDDAMGSHFLDTLVETSKFATRQVSKIVPDQVVSIGNKATRIATRKTKNFWNDLVDATFDDDDDFIENEPRQRKKSTYSQRQARRRKKFQKYKTNDGSYHSATASAPGDVEDTDRRYRVTTVRSTRDVKENGEHTEASSSPPTDTQDGSLPRKKRPIRDIIAELQALGISFSPTTSRQDMEELLSNAKQGQSVRKDNNSQNTHHDTSKTWSDLLSSSVSATSTNNDNDQDNTAERSVKSAIYNKGRKAAPQTKEKGKEVFRNVVKGDNNNNQEDTPLIVDAVIEDFSKDETIRKVEAELIPPEEWATRAKYTRPSTASNPKKKRQPQPQKRPRRRPSRNTKQPQQQESSTFRSSRDREFQKRPRSAATSAGRNDENINRQKPRSSNNAGRRPVSVPNSQSAQLPPSPALSSFDATTSGSNYRPGSSSRKKGRPKSPKTGKKKIYSPYGKPGGPWDEDDSRYYKDGIDEFGDFISNSVDTFLWGGSRDYYDDDDDAEGSDAPKKKKRRPTSSRRTGSSQFSGHWKDRMEEQFDRFMGIHEDGEYYNRWATKEDGDEQYAEGSDAVSNAQGRSSKRPANYGRRGKRAFFEKSFWGQDDGLLSFLFGTGDQSPDGASSSPFSRRDDGSLVRLIRSAFRSFSIVGGSLARWASVRGALPQPVVVVGTLTAGITALNGSRLRNMALTLLGMRVVGELLQGYLHDEYPFWNDAVKDDDEDENYKQSDAPPEKAS